MLPQLALSSPHFHSKPAGRGSVISALESRTGPAPQTASSPERRAKLLNEGVCQGPCPSPPGLLIQPQHPGRALGSGPPAGPLLPSRAGRAPQPLSPYSARPLECSSVTCPQDLSFSTWLSMSCFRGCEPDFRLSCVRTSSPTQNGLLPSPGLPGSSLSHASQRSPLCRCPVQHCVPPQCRPHPLARWPHWCQEDTGMWDSKPLCC